MFRSPRDQFNPPVPIVWSKICEKNYNETYACDMCSESGWTSETEVEIHKTKRHYRRVFMNQLRKRDDYCYICIKKCANRDSVVRHIKSEHLLSTETCLRVEREIFVCNHCSSIFFNKENIAIHLQYAHLDMTNMQHIRCLFCHKNILIRNIPGHFYLHNIQSVSTCRICLTKCENTKALTEHLKTHPYYLKCDMCYYETGRVDAFRNHVLTTHKNSAKMEISTTDDNELMTDDTVTDKYFMTDSVKRENLSDDDDSSVDKDLLTILEMMDMDTDNTIDFDSLMTDGIKGKKRKKRKNKIYDPKYTVQKKMLIAVENATVFKNVMKCSTTQTYMRGNMSTAKDLSSDHTDSDDLITIKDLVTDSVVTDNESGEIFTKESTMDEDLMTDDVKSENNFVTVIEISESKTTNTDDCNEIIYEIQTLNPTESVDSTTDQVSDSEIVTVIEIKDSDLVTDDTVTDTYCADNIQTDKHLTSKDEDFRRFFIPDCPTFVSLQRIAGIRGIRLSNDVHVCILCREVCVGLREMRSHVNEHKVKKEAAQNRYECSCGERFTNKVLLKHHAFKNQHVLN